LPKERFTVILNLTSIVQTFIGASKVKTGGHKEKRTGSEKGRGEGHNLPELANFPFISAIYKAKKIVRCMFWEKHQFAAKMTQGKKQRLTIGHCKNTFPTTCSTMGDLFLKRIRGRGTRDSSGRRQRATIS